MKRYTASIDTNLPIMAIDIGYSAQTASCALTYSYTREIQTIQFGECIETTRHLIEEKGKHTIILEAVLSTYHRPTVTLTYEEILKKDVAGITDLVYPPSRQQSAFFKSLIKSFQRASAQFQ